jgi:glycosyltransferase involved in cell wall biosynthesis
VWQPKLEVIHDGVDLDVWTRRAAPRRVGGEAVPDGVRIVTYVSRGLEAMRGFDVFVRVAERIAQEHPDVLFAVVGSDRVSYGNDLRHTGGKSFREHVLEQRKPDLSRFRFLGTLPPQGLADLLSLSDLHVYLTVPFVLSWSLLDAMACECPVVASDTAPVQEVIEDGRNGLLAPFDDVEALAERSLAVLRDPAAHHPLALGARRTIEERYALDVTFPRLWDLFERTAARGAASSGA